MALDLDKRSKVTNLCPWPITFTLPNSNGELRIEGHKSTTINNGELVTMKDNNNVMLCGTGDGCMLIILNLENMQDSKIKKQTQSSLF